MININARIKPIEGYPDYYIYDNGRVWSTKKYGGKDGRFLKLTQCKNGYLYVGIKQKTFSIHSLVAKNFVNGYEKGLEVCHNDGNSLNNHHLNLRWDTHINNEKDKIKHGTDNRGEKRPWTLERKKEFYNKVCNNNNTEEIIKLLKTNIKITKLSKQLGVSRKTIYNVNNGIGILKDVFHNETFPIRKNNERP